MYEDEFDYYERGMLTPWSILFQRFNHYRQAMMDEHVKLISVETTETPIAGEDVLTYLIKTGDADSEARAFGDEEIEIGIFNNVEVFFHIETHRFDYTMLSTEWNDLELGE